MSKEIEPFILRFMDKLEEDYTGEYLYRRWKELMPDATYKEWAEYCYSLESEF